MRIIYTLGKKTVEVAVDGPCALKVYEVPAAYSDDKLFAAVWMPGDLEPIPACRHADAVLLAHVELVKGDGDAMKLVQMRLARGEVRYAAN